MGERLHVGRRIFVFSLILLWGEENMRSVISILLLQYGIILFWS